VIQTSGLEMPCASYEVFPTAKPNFFKFNIQPVNVNVELHPRKLGTISDGFIEKSPLALVNNANLQVFDTDYNNYAGIIECKDTDGLFYQSITFASRTNQLSDEIINKMKKKLAGFGVDTSGLKIIKHDICV
jgi:hypothetical protein